MTAEPALPAADPRRWVQVAAAVREQIIGGDLRLTLIPPHRPGHQPGEHGPAVTLSPPGRLLTG